MVLGGCWLAEVIVGGGSCESGTPRGAGKTPRPLPRPLPAMVCSAGGGCGWIEVVVTAGGGCGWTEVVTAGGGCAIFTGPGVVDIVGGGAGGVGCIEIFGTRCNNGFGGGT